jgi:hypothetical protein
MAPHYIAQFAIVTINLLQHDGCEVVLPREEDSNPADGDMYDHIAPTLIASKNVITHTTLPVQAVFLLIFLLSIYVCRSSPRMHYQPIFH